MSARLAAWAVVLAVALTSPFMSQARPIMGPGGAPQAADATPIVAGPHSNQASPTAGKSVADGLYMTGEFTYVFSSGTATVTLNGVTNDSYTRTTGTLRLSLWALDYTPERGAGITGYRLANFSSLGQLQPRTYYSSIVRSAAYTPPPNGTYWLVLVLNEYNPAGCPGDSDGYCLEDSFVSYSPVVFGPAPSYDYSDLWWKSSEAGWGVAILHHNTNVAFIAWYTYDSFGFPMWYVGDACRFVGNSCTSKLYETLGPPFGPTFNPNAVSVFEVGSITLSFTGRSTGTMSYNVNGSTGFKAITRQPF
jgi:hypothetical protein